MSSLSSKEPRYKQLLIRDVRECRNKGKVVKQEK